MMLAQTGRIPLQRTFAAARVDPSFLFSGTRTASNEGFCGMCSRFSNRATARPAPSAAPALACALASIGLLFSRP
jgi:hypothetical protein